MEIGDLIALIARIFALLLTTILIFRMIIVFKKIGVMKYKVFYRILIIIVSALIIFVTVFPCYYILPSKIDLSSFSEVVDFAKKNKVECYYFQTKNYSGYFEVNDIKHLEEYKNLIKEFTKKEVVFEENTNEIHCMSAPVIATRNISNLGCRSNVESRTLVWDDNHIVYISYWYEAKGFFIHVFTFPELFYKEKINFNKIIENTRLER